MRINGWRRQRLRKVGREQIEVDRVDYAVEIEIALTPVPGQAEIGREVVEIDGVNRAVEVRVAVERVANEHGRAIDALTLERAATEPEHGAGFGVSQCRVRHGCGGAALDARAVPRAVRVSALDLILNLGQRALWIERIIIDDEAVIVQIERAGPRSGHSA